jgi:uncharacterized tellurite resistance protein B-like protein
LEQATGQLAKATPNSAGPWGHGRADPQKLAATPRHASCSVARMRTRLDCPTDLRPDDRLKLLRFAASFLWADLTIAEPERTFLLALADELDVVDEAARALIERPPSAEEVDPARVDASLAGAVRDVALRAIAADGHVAKKEMQMFHLLDALLPRELTPPSPPEPRPPPR